MGEVAILERYPAGRNTMVLISWVMLIVRDALEQDCLWQAPANNATARWRRERQATVHIYNRMHQHLMDIVRACDGIGHLVAMPVPYVYYHLMNVILSLNIFLLATVPALIGSWYTVVPFAIAALIIMGLREVACSLADPFGEDATDFPVPAFLNHAFDRAVCLLEATACPCNRERVVNQLKGVEEFTGNQLRRPCKTEVLYDSDNKGTPAEGFFSWTRSIACAKIKDGTDATSLLYVSLRERKREGKKMLKQPAARPDERIDLAKKVKKANKEIDAASAAPKHLSDQNVKEQIEEEKELRRRLKLVIGDLEACLARLGTLPPRCIRDVASFLGDGQVMRAVNKRFAAAWVDTTK